MTIGIIGCGFWAQYQIAAWRQVDPTIRFAFCDQVLENAQKMADIFPNSAVYSDLGVMLTTETLDLVDIITPPDSHAEITIRAARKGIPVICQKPMALNLAEAQTMVDEVPNTRLRSSFMKTFDGRSPSEA